MQQKSEFQQLPDETTEAAIASTMYTVVSLFFDKKDPEKIIDSLWNVARTEKAAVGYHDWLCDMMTDARYGQGGSSAIVVLQNNSVDTDDPTGDVEVVRVSPLNSDDATWRKLVTTTLTDNWKLCVLPNNLKAWTLTGGDTEKDTGTTVKRGQKRPASEKAVTTTPAKKAAPAKKTTATKKAAPTAAAARKKAAPAPAKATPAKKAAPKANAARRKAA